MVCVELEGELKRRRLAAGGVENHNPEQRAVRSPARSRRVESEVKPDTPAVASVRLRVQQLAQRRDGERRVIYLPLSMVSSEWFVFIMWVCVCVCVGGAALVQRCMSDPGTESPSSTLLRDVCHIGECFSVVLLPDLSFSSRFLSQSQTWKHIDLTIWRYKHSKLFIFKHFLIFLKYKKKKEVWKFWNYFGGKCECCFVQ